MATDPYVRVFRRIIDDPAFEAIYDDDRALATWLRLRIEADASWPSSASLPLGVIKVVVKQLVDSGHITLQGRGRFRMPDIDEDRGERQGNASNAAKARWSGATADQPDMHLHSDGDAHAMPTNAEQSSPPQARPSQGRADLTGVTDVEPPRTPARSPRRHPQPVESDDSWDGLTRMNGSADQGTVTRRRLPQ